MPTYQYACTGCGAQLEAVQKFTDDPLTECAECGGRLRKVFSPVGVVFKGSGFYRNDSRSSGSGGTSSGGKSGAAAEKSGDAASTADQGSSGSSSGDKGSSDSSSTSADSSKSSTKTDKTGKTTKEKVA